MGELFEYKIFLLFIANEIEQYKILSMEVKNKQRIQAFNYLFLILSEGIQ